MAKLSSSKLKILMILGVVVLLGGVGFGGYKMGSKGKSAAKGEKSVNEEVAGDAGGEAKESAKEGGEGEKKEGEKSEGGEEGKDGKEGKAGEGAGKGTSKKDLMFNFAEFQVNLFDPAVRTYLKTTISLEASSPDALNRIKDLEIPLREAIMMLLTSKTKEELLTAEGKDRIKRELLARFEGKLGPKTVNEIYLGDCVIIKQ